MVDLGCRQFLATFTNGLPYLALEFAVVAATAAHVQIFERGETAE